MMDAEWLMEDATARLEPPMDWQNPGPKSELRHPEMLLDD